jgi:hypothetical protein
MWHGCCQSMRVAPARSRGVERWSTRLCGMNPRKAGAWCGGSISMATLRMIWPVTAESIAPCSSIKWILAALSRSSDFCHVLAMFAGLGDGSGLLYVNMLTCKSPRKVMLVAYRLASRSLPNYSSEFSRHDFTLPQLFACLVAKEHMKRSYRGAEALLRDSDHWCKAIGMRKVPDHNTLCRAAAYLLARCRVDRLLDLTARWAAASRMLGLSIKPVAFDSTYFESHHVSRYYERRCRQSRNGEKGRKSKRARTVRGLPKLAVAVCGRSHLVLSMWTGTGMGSDHPHFEQLQAESIQRHP